MASNPFTTEDLYKDTGGLGVLVKDLTAINGELNKIEKIATDINKGLNGLSVAKSGDRKQLEALDAQMVKLAKTHEALLIAKLKTEQQALKNQKVESELVRVRTNAAIADQKLSKAEVEVIKARATAEVEAKKLAREEVNLATARDRSTLQALRTVQAQEKANAAAAKSQIPKLTREQQLQAQATNALAGYYNQLTARLSLNLIKWKQLSEQQLKNSAEGKRLSATIKQQRDELKKLDAQTGTNVRNVGNYRSAIGGLGASLKGLILTYISLSGAQRLIDSIFTQTKALDSLDIALKTTLGSQQKAAEAQAFLADITERYGLELIGTTRSYLKFRLAADAANLTVEQSNRIFESFGKTAAFLGLRVDEVDGVFKALEQIMSKGTVQSEELRGQLGDRLAGAFSVAAKAAGATTSEFGDLIKSGDVLASEFLPKFAAEFEKAFNIENVERVDNLAAAQQRFNNAWTELIKTLEGAGVFKTVFDTLTKGLEAIGDSMRALNAIKPSDFLQFVLTGSTGFFKASIDKAKSDAATLATITKKTEEDAKRLFEAIQAEAPGAQEAVELLKKRAEAGSENAKAILYQVNVLADQAAKQRAANKSNIEGTGTLAALREQQKKLREELEGLVPATDAFIKKQKELNDITAKIKKAEGKEKEDKSLLDKFQKQREIAKLIQDDRKRELALLKIDEDEKTAIFTKNQIDRLGLTEIFARERREINQKYDAIDFDRQLELEASAFELSKRNAEDRNRFEIGQEIKKLENKLALNEKYEGDLTETQIKSTENRIKALETELIQADVDYNLAALDRWQKLESEKFNATKHTDAERTKFQNNQELQRLSEALRLNKLLTEQERQFIEARRDFLIAENAKADVQIGLDSLQREQDLAQSKFDVTKRTEAEKKRLSIQFEIERIERILELDKTLSAAQIEIYRNQIASLQRISGETTDPIDIYSLLNITISDQGKQAISDAFSFAKEQMQSYFDFQNKLTEQAISDADRRVQAAETVLDRELGLMRDGYANRVENARKELDLAKKQQAESIKLQKKQQKEQLAINTALEASNLILGIAQIIADKSIPTVAKFIAIPLMLGAFALAKAKAFALASKQSFGEGGFEELGGGSHASGNDTDLGFTTKSGKRAHGEQGEGVGIYSRKAMAKYGKEIKYVTYAINKGMFHDVYMKRQERAIEGLHVVSNQISTQKMEEKLDAIRYDLRNQSKYRNGRYIDKDGNIIEERETGGGYRKTIKRVS